MLAKAERLLEHTLRALAFGGGVILLGLVAIVIYEIWQRYIINDPVFGGFEITELGMVVLVALGLPYTAITNGHVAVDVFARWLDHPALRWLAALVHLVGAALLAMVAWRAAVYAHATYDYGDLSNMLRIPKYPFQYALSVSAALFALVLVIQALRTLGGTPDAPSDDPI